MAIFTIQQLFTPSTSDDIRTRMVTDLVTMGVPADKWRKGGVASSILTVAAVVIAMMSGLVASNIQGFFLPTATGGSLKLLAQYIYGVAGPPATYASGSVTLTNTGGGTYTKAAGEYLAQNSTTKQTYQNTAAFSLGPSASVSVPMQAVNAGSIGNTLAGGIDTNSTALLGVTVTNPVALVGTDELDDVALRALCFNALGAMSVRGVRTAYAYAIQIAKNNLTGAPVNINRWSVSGDSHVGVVTVYVASPSGAADPNDVIGVGGSIEVNARPEGIAVVLASATASAYTRAITMWCTTTLNTTSAQIGTAAGDTLLAYLEDYPIGGITANDDAHPTAAITGLFGAGVYGALAEGANSVSAKVISMQGATDLILAPNEVVTNGVTLVVRIIPPATGTVL